MRKMKRKRRKYRFHPGMEKPNSPLLGGTRLPPWKIGLLGVMLMFLSCCLFRVKAVRKNLPMSESSLTATGPDFTRGDGLVPAIAQDSQSGEVLMMAYMNAESYAETVATGRAVYFSRSRKKLWRKGEESGNVQLVKSIYVDCDQDTILLKVEQIGGAACHEGYSSCFFRRVTPQGLQIEGQRVFDPAKVYKKST